MLPRARRSRCRASASATTPTGALSLARRDQLRARASSTSATTTSRIRCGACRSCKRLKEFVPLPIATNTVVVNFEQLAANVRGRRGRRASCSTRRSGAASGRASRRPACARRWACGVAVHSSGELGIQLATMLHLGAVVPNLGYAADAHYHHLRRRRDRGRPDALRDTARSGCPTRRASASRSTATSSRQYHELFRELRRLSRTIAIPVAPGWFAHVPNQRSGRDPARVACASAPSPYPEEIDDGRTTRRQDGARHGRRPGHGPRLRDADGRRRRHRLCHRRQGRSCSKAIAASPT